MDERRPIETAPKDGTVIFAWREIDGERMFEGPACWRTVSFEAVHDLNIPYEYRKAYTDTGWMSPDVDKRRPEPTHWHPR